MEAINATRNAIIEALRAAGAPLTVELLVLGSADSIARTANVRRYWGWQIDHTLVRPSKGLRLLRNGNDKQRQFFVVLLPLLRAHVAAARSAADRRICL